MAKQQPKVTIKKVVTKTLPVQKSKPVPVTRVKQVADSLSKTGKPKDIQRAKQLNTNVSTAVAKANANKPTRDSTSYFNNKASGLAKKSILVHDSMLSKNPNAFRKQDWKQTEPIRQIREAQNDASASAARQANKGKAGYDKNGYPKK